MPGSTRATLALSNFGVSFTLHTYAYDPGAERIGLQAADALGIEARRVLKTLMAEVTANRSASSSRRIAKSA